MAKVHKLKPQLMTEESFRPFGWVIDAKDQSADFKTASGTQLWAIDFQTESRTQIGFLRVPYSGLKFKALEQHHGVTQGFIPMGGRPSVMALAPPTSHDVTPAPEDVRAFLLDGTKGFILNKDAWHSLDRFPLYPPGCDWVILTDWDTTDDLKEHGQAGAQLTRTVDFEAQAGVTFEFVL